MKIVFMGTTGFAVESLNSILNSGHEVVGVITSTDKPKGRGRKLFQSEVKKCAIENNLNILQPSNLKDEEFIKELKSLEAELFIVVAFRMLPKVVWEIPKKGTFNLHASLLPNYRGAAPINWAIINGETTTGVTTFFIDEEIDTGKMILQEKMTIEDSDTAGTLCQKLMVLGAELVLKTIDAIAKDNYTLQVQQNHKSLRMANKIFTDTCKIDWDMPLKDIYNKIRGLSPHPVAWAILHNKQEVKKVKFLFVKPVFETHSEKIGLVFIQNKKLLISVKDGFLEAKTIQLENRKALDIVDLLNGFSFEQGAYFS
ncbi:methionyl-tRNA formyltransferase [Ichthyobacterium seriolicida]|uniref:Methionyl-tRNA formyltransferase n=1 Tax=Ichthyobacterium seriolicida TaxID=242600 RepID=A0A1J1DYM8_9FLAO|nr:methionyl-tRNA formyltransferase [Ichthyobacterium seriolicida]BAV95015.1 methionyl-tRNA formyltransferase [Ichthyobacterium seriolicida]